jgi:RNA polymerase sigma-70 factor (ECF subfamily)
LRYQDQAFEVALRIVRSPEDAEEVAQDAFIRAWRALEGFREEAKFSTWLYTIVTRCALDRARKLQRKREREADLEPEVAESIALPQGAKRAEGSMRRLERILAGLSPVRRAVVTLFYLREYSVEEVGQILEMPVGTVKTHLHRSRAALRKAWLEQEVGNGLF